MQHTVRNHSRPSKGERLNWVKESELKYSTVKAMAVKGAKVYSEAISGNKTFCVSNNNKNLLIP